MTNREIYYLKLSAPNVLKFYRLQWVQISYNFLAQIFSNDFLITF